MSLTASSWGQIGLLLGGGASTANGAILLKGVPWAEGLWIKCGDSGSEIQVKGFAHTLAWNADAKTSGGTITFSVVRSGDAIYVYDEGNALKMVLSESGIRLVNGAEFGEANHGTMACDAVIRGYFDDLKTNGDKTAVGFWTGMISTADGFAEWNIARDDAEQTAPDLNGMLADGISGGSSGTAVLDSETGKFTVNGSRYFARSLDDDFTLTATVSSTACYGAAREFSSIPAQVRRTDVCRCGLSRGRTNLPEIVYSLSAAIAALKSLSADSTTISVGIRIPLSSRTEQEA
ncbi:MAG: hypothetical protein ACLUSP_10695 [Christensenellales bacterium]